MRADLENNFRDIQNFVHTLRQCFAPVRKNFILKAPGHAGLRSPSHLTLSAWIKVIERSGVRGRSREPGKQFCPTVWRWWKGDGLLFPWYGFHHHG